LTPLTYGGRLQWSSGTVLYTGLILISYCKSPCTGC